VDDHYHVLLSGLAHVFVGDDVRSTLLPGDGFGEIAVLHRVPRSATVRADQQCTVLTFAGADLRAAVETRGGRVAQLAGAGTNDFPTNATGE